MRNGAIMIQVVVLFLVMLVGFYARKRNIMNDQMNKGLTELLLNITLPFMIIASFQINYQKQMLVGAGELLLYSIIIYIASLFIGKLLFLKFPDSKKSVLTFITIFSNSGFMGYPVIQSVYGKVGVFYAAIFNLTFNLFVWTVGVALFTGEKDFKSMKKALLNPGIVSALIGLCIFLFSIKLYQPIYNALDMVGSVTTPLSMIIIGSMLADMKIKDVFSNVEVYYGSAVRLVLMPAVVLIGMKLLGVSGILLGVSVLITAMPAAVNTAIISEKYGGDSGLASKCVFISTVLSIITIPAIISLL